MPTGEELQHLIWGVISTALYALPWVLGGFGALAFLSYGPIGKALRRLARSREEEAAQLAATAANMAEMRAVLEQMAERQDFMERALTQQIRQQPSLQPPREITPH